ncbi:AbrB/MazE/SpoVT family DNA-binding domain-containing protein [Geoalkalibacter sp.]|uniref:AbrB/MazE/SpoVT family DNA-binding domain-containing protein n=1 Tax=Geoalkalibacter sp. TaxID=3041440 RepID=UPI00272E827A|nr:AbrB/MazE/SpoVT family DNA-binding domain-containing protein [Geoalkalibacter sp.]
MSLATLRLKGQVTIPADVRQRLGLQAGDRIEFVQVESSEYVIKPAVEDVRSLKGLLRKPANPISIEDMSATVRRVCVLEK